jgi:hypothetical protein
MAETLSFTLELPKELVARVKAVKPSWLAELTDEEYLSHVIARGNFDAYLQQLENANAAVKKLAADLNLSKRGGPAQSKNKTGQRSGSKAGPNPPGEKSATAPVT